MFSMQSVAQQLGVDTDDMEVICENKKISEYVMDALKKQANTGAG